MQRLILDMPKIKQALIGQNMRCAKAMGMSKQKLSYITTKKKHVTFEDISGICNFLKRDVTDFVKVIEN